MKALDQKVKRLKKPTDGQQRQADVLKTINSIIEGKEPEEGPATTIEHKATRPIRAGTRKIED